MTGTAMEVVSNVRQSGTCNLRRMFVLNPNGHYFEVDIQAINVSRDEMPGCRFFDDEEALLQAVCAEFDLDLDEVSGSTFYVTMAKGKPVVIDDRGFATDIDEPIGAFLTHFAL
ncbi:TPA: hypothetical protein MXR76_004027 [Pseudomonas aeruginosa]|uniref:hypothetical protein n=1 Tax=Pseudomonas aeruginosa TaxID=287 RepID=UPI001160E49D|nr:hypothetical protein [Pseudomonas aeruginosa]EKF7416887.1 hypothetical protein [Pseudomonas aeruginosa]MDS9918409.1 hypothetical protein [Pseudomonas aeruginosa]HCA5866518.1 hypothetical protein [Pseudomonas aeruginosa]HCA7376635.1 hypothetical protein [Pseudomonas aeruginosa]HCA7774869.1 hypothetical protein [Pseudomonas aeruginosa]